MITNDYQDIEAGYITKRGEDEGASMDVDSGTEGSGDGAKQSLKREFSMETLMTLQRAQQAVSSLLQECRCEELTFESVRVVILDSRLSLSVAFFALEENGIRSAPIFDHEEEKFIGVLSFCDLVESLLHFYRNPEGTVRIADLRRTTIKNWRDIAKKSDEDSWTAFINADASLYETCCVLQEKRVHRLPVFARKSNLVVDVMTHARILRFVHERIQHLHRKQEVQIAKLFDARVFDLGIGTYSNLRTLTQGSPLVEALRIFGGKKLSCLPIVDSEGRIIDIFHRIDVAQFCLDGRDVNLNISIQEAIVKYRRHGIRTELCTSTSTLREIFDQFNATCVHRLYCVDSKERLVGVISLSDVFKRFL